MSPTQNQTGEGQGRGGGTLALLLARALACSLEVYLHRNFGERYLGAQALLAMLIMFVFPAFMPGEDPTAMMVFLGLYLVGLGVASAGIAARRKRGELGPHTFYTGTPCIGGRHISETTMKGAIEPMLAILGGAFLFELDSVLGAYLVIAGLGLLVSVQLTLASERKRVLDMHDAYEEQRRTAEVWRSMRRD